MSPRRSESSRRLVRAISQSSRGPVRVCPQRCEAALRRLPLSANGPNRSPLAANVGYRLRTGPSHAAPDPVRAATLVFRLHSTGCVRADARRTLKELGVTGFVVAATTSEDAIS